MFSFYLFIVQQRERERVVVNLVMEISGASSPLLLLINVLIIFLCFLVSVSAASRLTEAESQDVKRRTLLANGLGKTPPMGWNSWNHFNVQIKAHDVKNNILKNHQNGAQMIIHFDED